ncbi:MAG: YodL domain-containing protein [Oscillospiraceae bacterium]
MKIRIFQINSERDKNRVKFESLEDTENYQGKSQIDSAIYDEVFSGSVECKDLEDVYGIFNENPPPLHRGHFLSMSDIVEVQGEAPELVGKIKFYNSSTAFEECEYTDTEKFNADIKESSYVGRTIEIENLQNKHIPTVQNGFYFCDTYGYKDVDFDPNLAQKSNNLLKIVMVEPNKPAYIGEIENSLNGFQQALGGRIEATYPFSDNAFIYSNEESKLNGMDGNRTIGGELYAGPLVIVGDDGNSGNCSLTEEQLKIYSERFETPEQYSQEDVEESINMTFQTF